MVKASAGASAQERIAEGKRRRDVVSRQAHARPHPKLRQFDPMAVLLASSAGRRAAAPAH